MRLFWVCCLLLPLSALSQSRWHLSLMGGASNYSGDLQTKNFTLDQSNGAFGLGVLYDLTPQLALRAGFNYGKIAADDKKNPPALQQRNLNFTSKITELNLLMEFRPWDLEIRRFSPYLFTGLALYHFNPYTYDSSGNKYFLQPLGTEGQGLAAYPERKLYKLTQLSIPLGAGIRFKVNDRVSLGYEAGFRKTFTDYLDDVSTRYADPSLLLQYRGAKAVELAYRGGELKSGDPNYPVPGTIRGSSNHKDWYYFQGITVTIALGQVNPFHRRGSSLACPPSPI